MRTIIVLALLLAACGQTEAPKDAPKAPASAAPASQAGPPETATVFFVWPQDNSTVFAEFPVVFGVSGMNITPAGEKVDDKSHGHHHLIIDGGPIEAGKVVPMDEKHLHFGKAQTSTQVSLAPGKHTLTMQLADGNHISYGPKLAATITVDVVPMPDPKPRVFFVAPADGAQVTSPVKLQFGLEGMTLAPAGEATTDKTKGHHHVIIDGTPVEAGKAVPADEKHIHFGKAQTEAEIPLTPGKHTLTLQLADGLHLSYGPDLSATITVEVTGTAEGAAPVAPGGVDTRGGHDHGHDHGHGHDHPAPSGLPAPGSAAPGSAAPGTAAPAEAGHEGHQH